LYKPGASPVSELWKASLHKIANLWKAGLHKVHCANPGAVVGAMDFNGAWKNGQINEG
jgi:hypothetical protein